MLPNGELPVSLYEPMTMLGHFALPTKEDVPVEVIRAKHAGVCYGVERALDIANAAMLDDEDTSALGLLIHNPKVVENGSTPTAFMLPHRPTTCRKGIVIIRSHGVGPTCSRRYVNEGLPSLTRRCPHVAKAQRSHCAAFVIWGGTVVVVGRADHPQVLGVVQPCGRERAVVVANANGLPDGAYRARRRCGANDPKHRKARIGGRGHSRARIGAYYEKRHLLCDASASGVGRAPCRKVDAIVICGRQNSSNTSASLRDLQAHCPKSHFVEGADELDASWFEGCKTVGVTAGASPCRSNQK